MESLSALAAFVHAAEQRSYVAAARIAHVSPSAISKAVARLETRLGLRLLNRTTRNLSLTEDGVALYERCRPILDELEDVQACLADSRERPKGRLRVSVPHIVCRYLLMPSLPMFTRDYPEIELDVDIDDRVVNLAADGIDIAIRSGELADTSLIGRPLGDQHFVVCGSPDYLHRCGSPAAPPDLVGHTCIHFRYPSSGRLAPWSFSNPYERMLPPRSMAFNNTDAGLYAATAGRGLAHLPVYVASPSLGTGALVPVLLAFMAPFGSLSLLWPSQRRLSPKVRAFVNFAIDNLSTRRDAFQTAAALFGGDRQSPVVQRN